MVLADRGSFAAVEYYGVRSFSIGCFREGSDDGVDDGRAKGVGSVNP